MASKAFKCVLILFLMIKTITSQEKEDVNAESQVLNDIQEGKAPLTFEDSYIKKQIKYNKNIKSSGIVNKTENVDENGALYVWLQFSLRQIISLDEKNQILTSSSYLYVSWNDPRLSWNPANYSNTYSITTTASAFWIPDLAVMNAAGTTQFISIPSNQNIIITFTGQIFLTLLISGLQTRCKLNVYKYPFDKQNCSIVIGSWMSDTGSINFGTKYGSFDVDNYVPHPIWALEQYEQSSNINDGRFIQMDSFVNYIVNMSKLSETVSEDISFNIILLRQPMYVMMNGIFPCIVLNVVILLAFALPFVPQIGLCMTSFLTFAVSGVRISSDIPVQSEYLPLISLYIFLSILFTFFGFIWFILANFYSTKKSMPKILKLIVKVEKIISEHTFPSKITVADVKQKKNNQSPENPTERPKAQGETNVSNVVSLPPLNETRNDDCNFCKRCVKCMQKLQDDQNKSKDAAQFESDLSLLNLNVFFLLLITIIVSNLSIWIKVST